MTKRRRTSSAKSLSVLLKGLRAKIKKIVLAQELIPDDIVDDPQAIMDWVRGEEKRRRRRRKWE